MGAEDFGPLLKAERERAGLTQTELADRAGLTKIGVGQLEQGRRRPAWETVMALCDALGVSCEAFRGKAAGTKPRSMGQSGKGEAAAAKNTMGRGGRGRPRP